MNLHFLNFFLQEILGGLHLPRNGGLQMQVNLLEESMKPSLDYCQDDLPWGNTRRIFFRWCWMLMVLLRAHTSHFYTIHPSLVLCSQAGDHLGMAGRPERWRAMGNCFTAPLERRPVSLGKPASLVVGLTLLLFLCLERLCLPSKWQLFLLFKYPAVKTWVACVFWASWIC